MHDHAHSERVRTEHELQDGYKAARRLKYVNRFVQFVAESNANGDVLRNWAAYIRLGKDVRIGGIGVFSIGHGFICEGCNVIAGQHQCKGAVWKQLDCDCRETLCGANRFKRNCDLPREVKDAMVW